ncbi:MAG: Eco57I restriction-modification methylase domain-containing protein, partial [bacterium]
MNAEEILRSIINEFDVEKFIRFFRLKNDRLRFPNEGIASILAGDFTDGRKLAEGKLDDGEFIVCSFLVKRELIERSGKKAQYELGKKILKENQSDAGIFIFYDNQGNFRFSLIYTNYSGRRRDWSSFKRFTYFVSKEQTNKTFRKQISKGDFSTIEKIKEAFSVEPVTKQFYGEIQNWYFWAMDKIQFPNDYRYSSDPAKDKEIRNATNLIRLITRIIFIWFLKEKGLIPKVLFSNEDLSKIIRDFMKDKKASNFYNAILQNLFFATLNQKIKERKFVEEKGYPTNKKEYGVKNLYRYAAKFLIKKDEVLNLFKDIPFLNGGLFDCLDKEDETGKVVYIDGFSRNPKKQAIIPDYLFFQKEEEKIDLSGYGLGSNRPVRGLIEILNSYNFTIDENTPVDQEVALDPELLGKVFENLLASYNPETATTARKATGSYYTPREIVDYMAEESLLQYLKGKLSTASSLAGGYNKSKDAPDTRLRQLLSYSDEIPEFSDEEKQKIISAIDEIKILDPACGSGAFLMGILHKLIFILQKLDPDNKHWYELQYKKALKETEDVFKQGIASIPAGGDSTEIIHANGSKLQREERLKEINDVFDESINYPDYARKLYLIENCIYGIDIQPIAIQISKLRFFISLVLDQKVDKTKENFGIRALPNLETKFVAANTLIGLEKPNHLFYTKEVKQLEDKIKSLRHKYFTAKTRSQKITYQKKDKELRETLAQKLKSIGFSSDASQKIAGFDIYDQNASADWFDPEWMFGVKDGFDIIIGNPPYVSTKGVT